MPIIHVNVYKLFCLNTNVKGYAIPYYVTTMVIFNKCVATLTQPIHNFPKLSLPSIMEANDFPKYIFTFFSVFETDFISSFVCISCVDLYMRGRTWLHRHKVDPCILDPLKNMADCGETRWGMHSELIRHEWGLSNTRIDRILYRKSLKCMIWARVFELGKMSQFTRALCNLVPSGGVNWHYIIFTR